MNCLKIIESRLNKVCNYYHKSAKRMLIFNIVIYSLLFFLVSALLIIPAINEKGHLLAGDGAAQYHPLLLDFRRNMLEFIENLKDGHISCKFLNSNYLYGFDSYSSSFMYFFPFFPIYIWVIFVKEESTMLFFACAVMFISYLSGINFILMCRHFGLKNIYISFSAITYIFCGNYFATGIWNPQFMSMYFIFPFIIIGLDNILNDKSGFIFSLSVAFLAPGVTYLIYTIPFVIVFAVSRVLFTKKEHFFKNLLRYFSRSMIYGIIGIGIAAFNILPSIYFLSNSSRGISELPALSELIIPSIQNLTDTFYYNGIDGDTQICSAIIPFVLFVMISSAVKKEHKVNILLMLCIIALPAVWYGVNIFQYTLCRWGFIPACLFSYYSAEYADKIKQAKKSDLSFYTICYCVYLVLCIINFPAVASILMVSVCFLSIIFKCKNKDRNLSDLFISLLKRLKHYYIIQKDSPVFLKRAGLLAIIAILIICIILSLTILIQINNFKIIIPYIISASVVAFAIISNKTKLNLFSKTSKLLMLIFLSLSFVSYYNYREINSTVEDIPKYDELSKLKQYADNDSELVRFAEINSECQKIQSKNYFEVIDKDSNYESDTIISTDKETSSEAKSIDNTNEQIKSVNVGLRYDIASPEAFNSVIDSDYINFLVRCGADKTIFPNKVHVSSYYGQEPMYSLFGINLLYSAQVPENNLFGVSQYDKPDENLYIYKNDYALPLGSTYDVFSDINTFYNFNAAELPYAMINSVYLEGTQVPVSNSPEHYSESIVYDTEKTLRGTNSFGIKSYNNTLNLKDNTSDGFLYLVFDDVIFKTVDSFNKINLKIGIDDSQVRSFEVDNELNDWEWCYRVHKYTFPLGYHADSVKQLHFITPFEYGKMSVIFIPSKVYTYGSQQRNNEQLEDIKVSNNTVTGNLHISSDKVLVMSFLHNDGWRAYIDDKETEIYKANDLFLGIKVQAGSHQIKFRYHTPYFYSGIIISVISIFLLYFFISLHKKQNFK